MEISLKIYFAIFVVLAIVFGYFFKSTLPYIFCPLEKYKGQIGKGKTNNFLTLHLVLSLALSVTSFLIIANFEIVQYNFQNYLIRIFSFLIIWIISFLISGILIENFLTRTDKEYKAWKEENIKT